jgi:hypothetical protein
VSARGPSRSFKLTNRSNFVGCSIGKSPGLVPFRIREEARFIRELSGREVAKSLTEAVLGHVCDGLEQRERHIPSDDRGGLEEALVLRPQPVDPCRQDRLRIGYGTCYLHRGGDANPGHGAPRLMGNVSAKLRLPATGIKPARYARTETVRGGLP